MKLRIRGSSIRLRLTKSEVGQIEAGKDVSDSLCFGGGVELKYSLRPLDGAHAIEACFTSGHLDVSIPKIRASQWAAAKDAVSLEHLQSNGHEDGLFLLIEKDFACLKPRDFGEDETDLFINPNEAHGRCQ